jgi:NAD(P)H-hydrate epimerase
MHWPKNLYSNEGARALDRLAIEQLGISGYSLMTRAAARAFALWRTLYPRARKFAVVCGPGNNGGDGYVMARLAHAAGFSVRVIGVSTPDKLTGDALTAYKDCQAAGVPVTPFSADALTFADVVVDALLGTGTERQVEGDLARAIAAVNACGKPCLSLDLPSGLHATTGAVMGDVIRAHSTITFVGLKSGLFTGEARDCTGTLYFDALGVSPATGSKINPYARRIVPESLPALTAARERGSYKGNFGHVLVVGGNPHMPGAARLCGQSAYRAGAGLVSIATHKANAVTLNVNGPELIVYPASTPKDLKPLVEKSDVIAVGPGLGQSAWSKTLVKSLFNVKKPMVVDADALNLLAHMKIKLPRAVLTPHPGEAARLLNKSVHAIEADRYGASQAIAKKYQCVCILKGAGTVVASAEGELWVCDRGNPVLATAGTGDVLTGVIAGLLAQGFSTLESACAGVLLHATAGDEEEKHSGESGMLASDLLPRLRVARNVWIERGT